MLAVLAKPRVRFWSSHSFIWRRLLLEIIKGKNLWRKNLVLPQVMELVLVQHQVVVVEELKSQLEALQPGLSAPALMSNYPVMTTPFAQGDL